MKSVLIIEPSEKDEKTANNFIDWLINNKGDEFNEIIRKGNSRKKQRRG